MKHTKRFSLMVQHYGEESKLLEGPVNKSRADRALLENETIQRGYNTRVGKIDGAVVVFGEGDIYQTRIWIREA